MPPRTIDLRDGHALFDILSFARRGPGRTDRLSPAQIEQVARTVRRVPEVMVKVSGGGTSAKGVVAHFKYLTRRPEFEIETDDGESLRGRAAVKGLVENWDLEFDAEESGSGYSGRPGRKPVKLVHNIVLSMPAGTSPSGLLAASQTFAREQFALKHRYGMVLHQDKDHPHVHLVVKATGEEGQRLNIRKATLREWRSEFARHLRAQGIAANATSRAVRGVMRPQKPDSIYRAHKDDRSTHMYERQQCAAADILARKIRAESGKGDLLRTRERVEQGWRAIGEVLRRDVKPDIASAVERFIKDMPPPQTEREWMAAQAQADAPHPKVKERPAAR